MSVGLFLYHVEMLDLLTVPAQVVEESGNGMDLNIDLSPESGVVLDDGSAEEPCSHDVLVQEGREPLDELVSVTDNLGVDDLNATNVGGRVAGGLAGGSRGNGQGRSEEREDLHFERRESSRIILRESGVLRMKDY